MSNHKYTELDQKLLKELNEILIERPEAFEFVVLYRNYIHLIDDIVDEKEFQNSVKLLELQALASRTFTCNFWIRHGQKLIVTEQLINNSFADSVHWEKSETEWKRRDANVLRHAGLDMFFAVLLVEFGYNVMRSFSARFREQCHLLHTDENFQQV